MGREMVETRYRVVVRGKGGKSRRLPTHYGSKKEARAAFRDEPRAKYIEEFQHINYSHFPKTREAQMAMEKRVLDHVKSLNREGRLYKPLLPGMPWWNAMDRLEAKGLLRFYKTRSVYGPSGYIARGFLVRRGKIYRVKYDRKPFPKVALHWLWARRKHWGVPGMFGDEKLVGEVA